VRVTPGTRLGPYEIQHAIGAGGMGEVYKARDTRLDRTVAIKILPEAFAADPQFRERFDREARTISQLDHPHICALHDVGDQDGTAYLVMQYLDGDTLDQRLARGPLPLADALRIAIDLADALDKAHRAGVISPRLETVEYQAHEIRGEAPGLRFGQIDGTAHCRCSGHAGADDASGADGARDDSRHAAIHVAGATGGAGG
jgi:hypothetical protein